MFFADVGLAGKIAVAPGVPQVGIDFLPELNHAGVEAGGSSDASAFDVDQGAEGIEYGGFLHAVCFTDEPLNASGKLAGVSLDELGHLVFIDAGCVFG